MTISFTTCGLLGQAIFLASALSFLVFIVSVIVLDHNEKQDWSGSKAAFYLLPLYYPRESIAKEFAGWYPIYKYSGLIFIPCVITLFTGSYLGYLCSPS